MYIVHCLVGTPAPLTRGGFAQAVLIARWARTDVAQAGGMIVLFPFRLFVLVSVVTVGPPAVASLRLESKAWLLPPTLSARSPRSSAGILIIWVYESIVEQCTV